MAAVDSGKGGSGTGGASHDSRPCVRKLIDKGEPVNATLWLSAAAPTSAVVSSGSLEEWVDLSPNKTLLKDGYAAFTGDGPAVVFAPELSAGYQAVPGVADVLEPSTTDFNIFLVVEESADPHTSDRTLVEYFDDGKRRLSLQLDPTGTLRAELPHALEISPVVLSTGDPKGRVLIRVDKRGPEVALYLWRTTGGGLVQQSAEAASALGSNSSGESALYLFRADTGKEVFEGRVHEVLVRRDEGSPSTMEQITGCLRQAWQL